MRSEKRLSVLIIDDEPSVARAASRLLHSMGFETMVATGGDDAIDICRTRAEEIAVVLLDLVLQGMSSTETLSQVRSLRPGIKVILTSGYSRQESAARLSAMNPDGFVSKPFGYAELENAIRAVMA